MAPSVHKDKQGPVWPLGNIASVTPGVQVSIMSLVDATNVNAPETSTAAGLASDEYTSRAYGIIFQPFKAGNGVILAANTASKLVYIMKKSLTGSAGSGDTGSVIAALRPGDAPFVLLAPALDRNIFNLYEFFIDADTAGDGMQVTALIG